MHHKRLGYFDSVCDFYQEDFASRQKGDKNYERVQKADLMFLTNKINNYCGLAIFALYVDAAPANYDFYSMKRDLSETVIKQLLKNGLDMNHISGSPHENRTITDVLEELKRFK